jgi:uncharacterized protein
MKVALLGATGFVGSALLKEALGRGHLVTAIVHAPESNSTEVFNLGQTS